MPVLNYTKQVIMYLFDYVNIINNTHSQRGYLPGAVGAVAVPEVPCAIRPAVCPCAEFQLMGAVWLAVNAI